MRRQKNTGGNPTPRPVGPGHWLAGAMIGATIIILATRAILLGVGAAITDATRKGG